MAVVRVSREQLIDHVGRLAYTPEPTVVTLDGYPGSGKTTLAMAMGRLPGVAWVPLDGYRLNEGFDYKRLNKEIFKPFRKKKTVRRSIPKDPLRRTGPLTAKGETKAGVTVLVLEGMDSSLAAPALGTSVLCWVDCERQVRVDRLAGRNTIAGGLIELEDWMEGAELSGLREQALSLANYVVDTTTRTTQ